MGPLTGSAEADSGPPAPQAACKRRAATLVKAGVSAALLYFLIRRINADELGAMFRRTDPRWVLVSLLVGVTLNAISSWKWRLLLRAKGTSVPFARLLNLYFVGLFVNNFFPSTIGGDLFRGYEVGRDVGDRALAMASVFMERFTGMTALTAIALVAFVSNLSSFRDPRFALALGAGLLVYLAVTVAVVLAGPLAWGQRRFPDGLPGRLIGKLIRVQSAIHDYTGRTRAVVAALALSLLFHLTAMAYIYVSSRAFGVALPARTLLVIVPVIMFISSLPITVGGLGLFEWAYFFAFGASGAGGSPGLLVGLLVRANSLVFSLWGGIIYAVRGVGKGAGRAS